MLMKKVEKVAFQQSKKDGMFYGMFNVAQVLGHEMEKSQLIDIIKELDWVVTQNVDVEIYNDITRRTLEELEFNDTFENNENNESEGF